MKRLAIMTILMKGLLSVGINQTMAQQACSPDNLEKDAFKECWITQAKSGNKNLREAYLVNADLQNIDLSNADLSNSQIVSANLSGANFSGATLNNVNLAGTDFTGANFSKANLINVGFLMNNLTNADFTGAVFTKTAFSDTKIGGAKLDLIPLQCKVTTNGENLDLEDSNGKVYGSLKNGTIVYKDFFAWDNGRINVSQRLGNVLVGIGLVDAKFVTCANTALNNSTYSEILWDFREDTSVGDKPQEFMKLENDVVMKYLFGGKKIEDFEITTRVTGSFTKPNVKETLYYVGGCDDGDGFKAISNCSHASAWSAGWIAIYDGKTPIRKIEAALGYKIRFVTDVNGDGKEEFLSLSGYSGMGETTVRGELGQISATGYEKIFPLNEEFYFGSLERMTFNDDEEDKCYALASVVSYDPAIDGKFPAFSEEYFKSSACDSNWTKITRKKFDADQ